MKRPKTFPVMVRMNQIEYEQLKKLADSEKRSMGSQAIVLIRTAMNGAK